MCSLSVNVALAYSFLNDTTVTLKPGEVVCDQNITVARLIIVGVSILGILLCLLLLWINASAEAGLSNLSRHRLQQMRERHEPRAQLVEDLLSRPAQISSALNLLHIICLMAITGLSILAIHQFNLYGPEVTVMLILLIFVTMAVTRTGSKGYALNNPEKVVLSFSGFVNAEVALTRPLVWLVHGLSNLLLRLFRQKPIPPNTYSSEEEMALLANIGEEEGLIENEEREMIRNIFQFDDTFVREVMVPRLDIKAIPSTSTLDEALDMIISSGKSRLPVYQPDIDHIKGILYAKDLMAFMRQHSGEPIDLTTVVRPAYYVPESKKVDQLLAELQNQRVHIAIIVDEYGGTAGLVTIEDLLEEIVGEIQDEYDTAETADFERISQHEVLVDARLNLGDVNDFFKTYWESEDTETIGGFVYDRLGRIPEEGDRLAVDREGQILNINEPNPAAEEETEGEAEENPAPALPSDYYLIQVEKVTGQRLRQLRLLHIFPSSAQTLADLKSSQLADKDAPDVEPDSEGNPLTK
jgi:CBS domain containing-hemolysin-like protein